MKRMSEKRRERMKDVDAFRDELFDAVGGQCEWCGARDRLDPHEIARAGSKQQSMDQRCAVLLLCRDCHDSIHRSSDDRAIGLAVLYLARSSDFDIERFYKLEGKRYPDLAVVLRWSRRLSLGFARVEDFT